MSETNEQSEQFHEAHGPRGATPSDVPELRYAPETASMRGILGFVLGVMALIGIAFATTAGYVRYYAAASERPAELEWVQSPPPGTNVDHWSNPQLDLQRLQQRERERLQTYGWIDRDRGVIRIPIEQAMRQRADQQPDGRVWMGGEQLVNVMQHTSGLLATTWRVIPPQASRNAAEVDMIYFALVAFALLFTFLIFMFVVYFVVKYRRGSLADRRNPIERTLRYEIVWVAVPLVLALGLFVWAAKGYFDFSRPPANARTIYVVGKQWMWKIDHPGGQREINTLHVPVGETIRLVMTSQDVIHSFYIPAFRMKYDVLPDRYTQLWFEATTPGRYHLFCTEYCGAEHSRMVGEVVVLRPAEYEQWLSAQPPPGEGPVPGTPGMAGAPLAVRGQGAFFELGCNACHVPGSAVRAPRLDGLFGGESRMRNGEIVIADESYLRESILQPNARIVAGYDAPSLMPTYEGQINEQTLNELIEFIRSIRDGWPEEGLEHELENAATDR